MEGRKGELIAAVAAPPACCCCASPPETAPLMNPNKDEDVPVPLLGDTLWREEKEEEVVVVPPRTAAGEVTVVLLDVAVAVAPITPPSADKLRGRRFLRTVLVLVVLGGVTNSARLAAGT